MRIFSLAENLRRVALRISCKMFLAIVGSFYLLANQVSRAEIVAVGCARYAHFTGSSV